MTRLLYIPNGTYLSFYLVHSDNLSTDINELGNDRPNFKTAKSFIDYLLNNMCDATWYEINNIDYNHKFLRCELEIVED